MAVLVAITGVQYHTRIEATALERGGVSIDRDDDRIVFEFTGVPAAVRSAFDILSLAEITGRVQIGVVSGENGATASRLAEMASPGTVAIDGAVYTQLGGDTARFSFVGDRLFPNAGSTVRVYTSTTPAPPGGSGEPGIRSRLLELIRLRGTRPTRAEAIRLLALHSETELTELAELEHRGFIRAEGDVELRADDSGEEDDDPEDVPPTRHGHRQERPRDAQIFAGPLGRLLRRRRDLDDDDLYELYRATFEKRLKREQSGLAGHTSSFLGVNAFLAVIWGVTGAGFPWFLIPFLGWGIGWVSHRTAFKAREQEYAEVLALPGAGRRELRAHRKLWKIRRSWRGHLASTLATMALLGTINIITGGGFPWALIPSAAMGIGLVTHYSAFRQQERDLLEEGEIPPIDSSRSGEKATGSGVLSQARSIQRRIEQEIAELPEAAALLGDDFRQVLSNYIEQLEGLDRTQGDVRDLISAIAIEDLDREYARLEARLTQVPEGPVASEYRASLEQIDLRRRSYRELASELEMLELRSSSALHALDQLKIDVVRTKNTRSRTASVDDLRVRSSEISRYLEDLRSGYEELS